MTKFLPNRKENIVRKGDSAGLPAYLFSSFFKAIYKSYFLMGGRTGLCLKEFKSHAHLFFFFDRIYDNLLYVPSSFLLCPLTSEKWKTYIII